MVRWEDAFLGQRQQTAPTPQPGFQNSFPSGYEQPPVANAFQAPPERTQPESRSRRSADNKRRTTDRRQSRSSGGTGQRSRRRRSNQAYPPTLARLHNHLDDIWVNIMLEAGDRPKSLLVCGAASGEHSGFFSFHLALFLALGHNLRTVFIDTNVNSASNNPYVPAASPNGGLSGVLVDHRPIKSVIARTEYDNFYVIPSGSETVGDKSRNVIIENDDLNNLVGYCHENFDVAVFAGQPVVARPVMLKVGMAVDNVVMVCRYGFSRREVTRLAIDRFRENNVSLLGLILTDRQYPVPQWVYKILK
jgi:Mrp family chromosome partitioning ATPase